MPRMARVKNPEYIYHITCRSMSEMNLFRDTSDKNYYLDLIKRYKDKYSCKIYAYCIMDTHVHIHIDPQGFDISKFMHCLNVAYVIYYNRKYKRHGHLFQDRFNSYIVSSDSYNMAVSAYIHNNPKDIPGYENNPQDYPFSSMSIYLGTCKDYRELINTDFILGLFNLNNKEVAIKRYTEFVLKYLEMDNVKTIMNCIKQDKNNVTRNERRVIMRNADSKDILKLMKEQLEIAQDEFIHMKNIRGLRDARAFYAFIENSLCGRSYKEICRIIGNMSLPGISKLCSKGSKLFMNNSRYKDLFYDIVLLCR